ncbi:putative ribonuclease H-like domain-containing protein [Tanacetum coccineum]
MADSKKFGQPLRQGKFTTLSRLRKHGKGHDRFQKLLSQLDALGAGVSDEDANHKFLRSVFETRHPKDIIFFPASENVAFLSTTKASSPASISQATAQEAIVSYPTILFQSNTHLILLIAKTAIKIKQFITRNRQKAKRECKFKRSSKEVAQEAGRGQDFKPITYNALQAKYDELQYEFGDQEAALVAHKLDEDIDDSLYEYGKHGPQPKSPSPTVSNASSIVFSICPSNDSDGELGAVSDASTTHYSTCQSNDSDGELGTVSDHSVNDASTNDHIPIPSIEQVTIVTQKTQPQVPKPQQTVDPSCAQHVKSPRQPIRTPVCLSSIPSNNRQNRTQGMQRDLGTGYSFVRKPCFVCGSLSHLIKDCDYYEKKMAREAALKSTRVVHANVRQATPAWTNSNRVNKANQFTPRPVQLNNIRPNLSTASKTIKTGRVNVNTGHGNVSSVSSAGTQFKSGASRFNTGKQHVSSGRIYVNSGTQIKSGGSRFNTGKQNVNSGRVHVNTARVNRPVLSNQTSQGNNGPLLLRPSGRLCLEKTIPNSNTNSGPNSCSNVQVSRGSQGRPKPVKAWSQRETNPFLYVQGSSTKQMRMRAKASSDEAKLWHRRLGHLNFKNLNKLVKGNLVRGLPSKSFKNDHTCVACQKGKQHKASCKAKIDRYVTHPLHTLHMDLFGPTSVRSINHASYCLVITDDCSRFCWVFFLAKKDETSDILKTFIRQIENQLNQKVKIIRSDNGTEFKNRVMLEFCGEKGIKQEFSNARTPQQNGVAERMNRTLIEAARTMLADSHLPTTFWAEAVNTACYTFNRVRVTKPQNKTPYELLFGHKPILSYIRPFGCHVTILNTLSPLGKFDGKSDEGFLVGYSVNSKAFRVYNLVTKRVEVNLHVNFLEEKPNVQGIGHRWMFDLDYLTDSMNYIPVSLQNQANPAGSKEVIDIDVQTEEAADLMVVSSTSLTEATRKAAVSAKIATKKTPSPKQPSSTPISKSADDIMTFRKELDALALKHLGPVPAIAPTSNNHVNTGSINLNIAFEEVNPGNIEAISPSADHEEEVFSNADDDEMPEIRIYDKSSEGIFEKASYDDDGIITDFNNLLDEVAVSTNHTLRIHNAHPQSQILGDPNTHVHLKSSEPLKMEAGLKLCRGRTVAVLASTTGHLSHGVQVALTKDGRKLLMLCTPCKVTPKTSHLNAIKRIFKYLKGKPNLGLWYPRESPLDLEAFSDSDYGGSNLDTEINN